MEENEPNTTVQPASEGESPADPTRRRRGGRGRSKRARSTKRTEGADSDRPDAQGDSRSTPDAGSKAPKHARQGQRKQARQGPAPGRRTLSSVGEIVHHVREIVESLQDTLDNLEQAIGALDKVEQQQGADIREIEELKNALNQLHYRRPSDPHHRGSHSQRTS